MKLFIEINEREYQYIKEHGTFTCPYLSKAIKESEPLPEPLAEQIEDIIHEYYKGVSE